MGPRDILGGKTNGKLGWQNQKAIPEDKTETLETPRKASRAYGEGTLLRYWPFGTAGSGLGWGGAEGAMNCRARLMPTAAIDAEKEEGAAW